MMSVPQDSSRARRGSLRRRIKYYYTHARTKKYAYNIIYKCVIIFVVRSARLRVNSESQKNDGVGNI